MIIRHRGGCNGTTPRCRSRNVAGNPTNLQVCGPRQPPTVQETLQIPRFHAECCKTQVLGPYHGGGGVVANREPGSYIYICTSKIIIHKHKIYYIKYDIIRYQDNLHHLAPMQVNPPQHARVSGGNISTAIQSESYLVTFELRIPLPLESASPSPTGSASGPLIGQYVVR